MSATLSAVVPTLGLSRWLVPSLEALRRSAEQAGASLEVLLVAPERLRVEAAEALADRVLRSPRDLGFAAANNLGFATAGGRYLATVNDDAVVDPGWCRAILEALDARPGVAAAQGINRRLNDPERIDGAGIAWNRHWQAVQIGRDERVDAQPRAVREIFGVSATAAVYRRAALETLGAPGLEVFDPRLGSYYEDVDLACRLRARGFSALLVPAAGAAHAGSTSGARLPGAGVALVYGNRQLVLARLLGRAFWPRWPRILLRDAVDLGRAAGRGETRRAAAIVAGGGRFLRLGRHFVHAGPPLVPLAELRRFRR